MSTFRDLSLEDARDPTRPMGSREGAAVSVGVLDGASGASAHACPFDHAGLAANWRSGWEIGSGQRQWRGTYASRSVPTEAQ